MFMHHLMPYPTSPREAREYVESLNVGLVHAPWVTFAFSIPCSEGGAYRITIGPNSGAGRPMDISGVEIPPMTGPIMRTLLTAIIVCAANLDNYYGDLDPELADILTRCKCVGLGQSFTIVDLICTYFPNFASGRLIGTMNQPSEVQ